MNKKLRTLALALVVIIAFVMLFSPAFVISRASHHCVGSHCSVCLELKACAAVIKTMSAVSFVAVGLILCALFCAREISVLAWRATEETPVSLKVKLIN